ncbi:MAG: hypothetical protein ABIW38_11555 [Ferruginibacter sp.]
MRTFLVLWFLCIISLGAFTQDLSGRWVSHSYTDVGKFGEIEMILDLTQHADNSISGYSKTLFSSSFKVDTVICLLEGYVKKKTAWIAETEILKNSGLYDNPCLQEMVLKYIHRNNSETLWGRWASKITTCGSGDINLKKINP